MSEFKSSKFPNFFDESIKIISFCPICNARYNPIEARVLEEKEDAHLIYIRCRRCQASVVALILANNLGISSIGLVTDLNSEDILKFKSAKPISSDDVIDIHQLLEEDKIAIDRL